MSQSAVILRQASFFAPGMYHKSTSLLSIPVRLEDSSTGTALTGLPSVGLPSQKPHLPRLTANWDTTEAARARSKKNLKKNCRHLDRGDILGHGGIYWDMVVIGGKHEGGFSQKH